MTHRKYFNRMIELLKDYESREVKDAEVKVVRKYKFILRRCSGLVKNDMEIYFKN